MARPDVRFNTPPPPPPTPAVDLAFAESSPEVIDLRDRLGLSEAEARAILGVGPDAEWETVKQAYTTQMHRLDTERHRINTAYATLRLLAVD